VKDELRRQVQELLDRGEGLSLSEALAAALDAEGPHARAEAEDLAAIDLSLRAWPDVALTEDAGEAIATRIEQRLDEDLARMPDPAAPPIFSDKEGQPPKATAAGVGLPPKPRGTASGEYSLANLKSLSVKNAPVVKPDAPLKRPPKPMPMPAAPPLAAPSGPVADRISAEEIDLDEIAEKAPLRPPPTPRKPLPKTDERASIPSVAPFDLGDVRDVRDLPPPPVDLEARQKRNRAFFYWGSGLAAAAALLVVVVTGISTLRSDAESVASTEAAAPVLSPSDPYPMPPSASVADESGARGGAGWQASPSEMPMEEAADEARTTSVMAEATPEPQADPESEAVAEAQAEAAAAGDSETMAPTVTEPRQRRARLARTTGTGSEPRRTMASAPAMSARGSGGSPSREDVVQAMRAVSPQVAACAGTRHGVVRVNITVGGSGRVQNAVVQGEFAGSREGSCVARAVRRARLPEFSRDSFSFVYPFQL
jgi:hypothetical protein